MLRFLLSANHGYWFRPHRNPYLRWRIETYSGIHAESITPMDFWRFIFANRWDLLRFLRWTHNMAGRSRVMDGSRPPRTSDLSS
jgi:hypothetical protein